MSAPLHAGIHPPGTRGRHPPGQTPPPAQCMLGYGREAGGTHPTGMHSCSGVNLKRNFPNTFETYRICQIINSSISADIEERK